jgi:hypothetical protein|tara:strand:+ start:367 stop:642 length:276 start_codon:yes stop_codon:yes gene_type:complete
VFSSSNSNTTSANTEQQKEMKSDDSMMWKSKREEFKNVEKGSQHIFENPKFFLQEGERKKNKTLQNTRVFLSRRRGKTHSHTHARIDCDRR